MSHVGEERLLRWALDELDAEVRLEVERHLASCPRCATRAAVQTRLDELLLRSAGPVPPGAAERALERLWREVDAAPGASPSQRPPRSLWRTARPWASVAAVAAVLVLCLKLASDVSVDPEAETPVAWRDEPAAGSPGFASDTRAARPPMSADDGELAGRGEESDGLPGLPTRDGEPRWAVWSGATARPGATLDTERLRQVRGELSELLRAELDDEARRAALARWRRDGWPVASLLRALALGDDDAAARAAVAVAADDPATLAAVLDDGQRADAVLDLLERDAAERDAPLVLLRALERRAEHDGRALRLLARARGGPGLRALDRVWRDRMARLRGQPHELALPALVALAEALPADRALALLLEGSDEPGWRTPLAPVFAATIAREREAALAPLEAWLADDADAVPDEWIVEARLVELVPALLAGLEGDARAARRLGAVVALGGEAATLGLHALWEAGDARERGLLLPALSVLLADDPSSLPVLSARLAERGSEAVLNLAEALPESTADALLIEALAARDGGSDVDGHTAALLAALARTGRAALASQVLEWLEARDPRDALAPLGWAVVAHLDGELAERSWAHRGRDPDRLARVARAAARPFGRARPPSARVLEPLERALAHDAR